MLLLSIGIGSLGITEGSTMRNGIVKGTEIARDHVAEAVRNLRAFNEVLEREGAKYPLICVAKALEQLWIALVNFEAYLEARDCRAYGHARSALVQQLLDETCDRVARMYNA
jgi:hypothetical protein